MQVMSEAVSITRATILVAGALFPIVNPLGSAAIFLNLIGNPRPEVQNLLARRISLYSFFLLICSLLWGVKVLSFFGISIYAVQIGGGLVVAATGWTLLAQSPKGTSSVMRGDDDTLAQAFYPLTLPITVGPGSISVAITLGAHLPAELHEESIFSLGVLLAALIGIVVTCGIVYLCYRYARDAERLLGATGTSVFMRLTSFILLCIGIQIISTGVKAYLASLLVH
jgi:multiple antibiotic resistance protein